MIRFWAAPFTNGWFPRLSPDGRYVASGFGGGRVYDLTTQRLVTLNGWWSAVGWLDVRTLVMQTDSQTFMLRAPDFVPGLLYSHNYSWAGAGGLIVAGTKPGRLFINGVLQPQGDVHEQWIGCDVARDGTIVTAIDKTPPTLVTIDRDGRRRDFAPLIGNNNAFRIGPGGYVGFGYYGPAWVLSPGGGQQEVTVTPDRREGVPLPFMASGRVWLASGHDYGVLVRPLGDRETAIVVHDDVTGRGPSVFVDVAMLDDNIARVAFCDDKGRLTVADVDLRTYRKRVDPFFEPLKSRLWFGAFFQHSEKYGDAPADYPSNVSVVVEETRDSAVLEPRHVTRALGAGFAIVDGSSSCLRAAAARPERVVALYEGSEASASATVIRAMRIKREWASTGAPPRPLVCYVHPGMVRDGWDAKLDGVDWWAPQFYLNPGTSSELVRQIRTLFDYWRDALGSSKPWMPICQAYDRATFSVDQMRALVTATSEFLSLPTRVEQAGITCKGLLFFAAMRPGGTTLYPDLLRVHRAMFRAITGVPAVETIEDEFMNKPEVEVQEFTGPITRDNWHFVTRDKNNPDLVIDTWIENGSIYQRITHRGGTAKTGKFRPVV